MEFSTSRVFEVMKITKVFCFLSINSLIFFSLNAQNAYAGSLAATITIPGNDSDLSGQPNNANGSRLGGFFSDLYYDRNQNVYYGLSDRGPGGGVYSYDTRVQKFKVDVNPKTGAISNFLILDSILLTKNGQNFNGLNPEKLNGNVSTLGLSLDPEGFTVAPNGNFYISDEYGPSVYEFSPDGKFVKGFTTPSNLIPKESDGKVNYVDGRSKITSGRQDNRGFEGLALSPDGSKVFGMLQGPLVNEGLNTEKGTGNEGRYSRNLRIVEFDTATGNNTGQYIYQLESLSDINSRVPSAPFNPNQQGRNIGISSIIALNNDEFLVLERDNRGIGVDSPSQTDVNENPVASKRFYKIDLKNATDVSNISLEGTNDLNGITPVSKSLFLDFQALLQQENQLIPEKLEGVTIGPKLEDGSYALLTGTDNDYSVTQDGSNTQLDVCTNLSDQSQEVTLNSPCPLDSAGKQMSLIPTYLYSVKADVPGYIAPVPEPFTIAGTALGLLGFYKLKKSKHKR